MKTIHKMNLIYGKKYGVTKVEARNAYIKGFKEGMKEHKSFWKVKEVKFV